MRSLKDQFGFIQSTSRRANGIVFRRQGTAESPPEVGQEVAFQCLTEMKRSRMDGSSQEQYRAGTASCQAR